MAIRYLDFDLLIERAGDGYKARVLDSPAGEASGDFAAPFTPEDINNFFVQIGQTRSFETQQTRRIREFGQSLFEAVFTGPVRDRLRASMGEASLNSTGLRIRLRLSGTPELGNLPWEFLYDPGISRFLALSVETPIVRYLETQQMAQPLAVQPPLRILTMICSPQDYPRLDVEREWENLQQSMSGLQARGLVDLVRLDPPTLASLQQQLRREQYHIFHFIGHGVFSRTDQDGFLLFENALRGGQRVSGHDLGTLLHDHRPLRLTVLNACEGARASVEDQFAGTAQSLVRNGIPAVIAMQFRITDQASIMLAREFYGALADGYPVDAALTEARKAIKTEGNDLEWGTPVLYMRTPDGRIFDIAAQPASARTRPPVIPREEPDTSGLDRLYTEALEAFYLGQWEKAAGRFQSIVDTNPDYKDAAAKLETVQRKLTIQTLDRQAVEAEASGNWETALEALNSLALEDPAFPGVTARLAHARRQDQIRDLRTEAGALAEAGKWEAVLGLFKEMDRIEPRLPDPTGLRARAEQATAKAKTERELESSYASALQAMSAGDPASALRHLKRVRQLQPGYRESESLLRGLESQAKPARKPKAEKPARVKAEPAPAALPSGAIHLEWSLPVLFGVFALVSSLASLINGVVSDILTDSLPLGLVVALRWLPGGILTGLIFWALLSRAIGPLTWPEKLQVLGAAIMGQWIIGIFVGDSTLPEAQWYFLWALYGAVFGFVVLGILRRRGEIEVPRYFISGIVAWGLAYGISALLGVSISWDLKFQEIIPDESIVYFLLYPILMTFGSFLGWWFTLAVLKANHGRAVNWKTTLAGALGFGLVLDADVSMFMVERGLIGGAALAYPSRNPGRYFALLATGFLSIVLAYFLAPNDMGIFFLISGLLLGLCLGLDTRRPSGILICMILGITAFGIGYAISYGPYVLIDSLRSEWELPFEVLGGGLMGALLAAGWSYLKSPRLPADH